MQTKECDILIIGAGPAGLTAGIYAARAGNKTFILEEMIMGGAVNLTPDICNYPGFEEISGSELGEKMSNHATSSGAETIYDEIVSIDFNAKAVTCETSVIIYKALIIATGAKPLHLGVSREDEYIGAGVHFCALCDGAFYKGKDVIIVGGGNHAVEEAIYMSKNAKSVTMINATNDFNAQSVLVDKLENVKVFHGHTVTKILGDDKINGVEIQNIADKAVTKLDCQGIFVAIGRRPNSALFKDVLKLTKEGYVIVDDKMQTNIKGVFAAGDVIQKHVRQIITACADGAIAATHASEYIK